MKVPPLNLTPEMNRVGMALSFNPELIWRSTYSSMGFPQSASAAPPSPLEVKSQLDMKTLPSHLSLDPKMWSRDDVIAFLRWVEREYDLPSIDHTKFCMNGKALLMLNKADLTERAPDAGDIVHNTLQQMMSHSSLVPPSPLTPHHPMLSPSPLTSTAAAASSQTWPIMHAADFHSLSHLLQQNSSVTLSPAHSEQSGGSPRHPDNASTTSNGSAPGYPHSGSQSDSEDSTRDASSPQRSPVPAPPPTQPNFSAQALAFKQISDYQRAAAAAAAAAAAVAKSKHQEEAAQHKQLQQALQMQHHHHQQQQSNQHSQQLHHHVSHQLSHHSHPHPQPRSSPPLTALTATPQPQQQQQQQTSEEAVETGTNGRLLWDFLQQLLNDREGRYSRYIAWRNAETGVFKIVDPPGLARLWGIQKNHLSMNYDKMSRALRYYYRVNILRKVQGERHCYQFLRNPTELRNIKNISSLKMVSLAPQTQQRQQQQQQSQQQHSLQQSLHIQTQLSSSQLVSEHPEDVEEEGPTDLSMATLHHHSSSDMHHLSHRRSVSPRDMSIDQQYIKMEEEEEEEVPISVDYDD